MSPLLPYANSSILVESSDGIAVTNGRIVSEVDNRYLIQAFLKRQQSADTETGATKLPTKFKSGKTLPGASGEYYLYRGYALQYAVVPASFEIGVTSEASLSYYKIQKQHEWMLPGQEGLLRFGKDTIMKAQIERSSGTFGGVGIDEIIYYEIGGIEFQIIGTEIID